MADKTTTIKLEFDDSGAIRSIQTLDGNISNVEGGLDRVGRGGAISFAKLTGSIFTAEAALRILETGARAALDVVTSLATQAFEATRGLESSSLATRALLANQLNLSKDAAENFQLVEEFGNAAVRRLQELDRQSAATFDQLFTGFNTVVAKGGLQLTENLEDALQLTNLLVNASVTLDTQYNKELAIRTNISKLLSGENDQRAEVVAALGMSNAELDRMLATARQQHNLFETLATGPLRGINAASGEFGKTWDGILSTSKTIRDVWLRTLAEGFLEELKIQAIFLLQKIDENHEAVIDFLQDVSEFGKTAGANLVTVASGVAAVAEAVARYATATLEVSRATETLVTLGVSRVVGSQFDDAIEKAGQFAARITDTRTFLQNMARELHRADISAPFDRSRKAIDDILTRPWGEFLTNTDQADKNLKRIATSLAGIGRVSRNAPGQFPQRQFGPPTLLTDAEQMQKALDRAMREMQTPEAMGGMESVGAQMGEGLSRGLERTLQGRDITGKLLEPLKMPDGDFGLGEGAFRQHSDLSKLVDTLHRIELGSTSASEALRNLFPPEMLMDADLGIGKLLEFTEGLERTQERIANYADLFQDSFVLIAQGVRSGGLALVAALAQVIGMVFVKLGSHLIGQGIAEMALGSAPLPFGNPALFAHGAMLVKVGSGLAAGGVVAQIAGGAIGTVAGATGRGGAPGSPFNPVFTRDHGSIFGGNQVIDISGSRIQAQQQAQTNAALAELAESNRQMAGQISRLETTSPGKVIQVGAREIGGADKLFDSRSMTRVSQKVFGDPRAR